MSRAVRQRFIRVPGVSVVVHISHVTSDRVWISDKRNIVLTNTTGDILYHLTGIADLWGVHTVNRDGELIYIDSEYNIHKLSIENNTNITFIKHTAPREAWSVFSSPTNGDLLVGMRHTYSKTGKVNRYNNAGQHIQTIQHNDSGEDLYLLPIYVTENRNGDVIVSDWKLGALVVTDREGRHRFSYKGQPGYSLDPRGVCTDALSHILVCDTSAFAVELLDQDGNILSKVLTTQDGQRFQCGIGYDDRTQLLWVGSDFDNTVDIYRLTYKDSLTAGLPCRVGRSSEDHSEHDSTGLEEIHMKGGDAVLMLILLCQSYRINLEEEYWIEKYNVVAERFNFRKYDKESSFVNLEKYRPVLKLDLPVVSFSSDLFRHASFLRFADDPKFVDVFLTCAEKDNVSEYCRSWLYPKKDGEIICWLLPRHTRQLIDRLGEDIYTHPTLDDPIVNEVVLG
ncbi:uncharacterized protein LOC134238327 [Saccostrea cucullata]|uniref:uncharacterized protein LOC134238327 n=1 Tax=Saccostrea cuccullata TaxID=36930 RepID=UPI002ED2B0FB